MSAIELRERRLKLGLSQAKLAQQLGLHRVTIYLWEGGKPISFATVIHLALCHLETMKRNRERPKKPEQAVIEDVDGDHDSES